MVHWKRFKMPAANFGQCWLIFFFCFYFALRWSMLMELGKLFLYLEDVCELDMFFFSWLCRQDVDVTEVRKYGEI